MPEQVEPHYSTVPFRKIFVNAAKDVLRLVALLAHGDTGDEVDQCAEHHLLAGRLSGRDRHLDRGHRLVDQLADARLLGVGLKVRPARLLRHLEHVLGQMLLVGALAGCGILGGPLNVHHSNYVRHVGLVLAVTKATK